MTEGDAHKRGNLPLHIETSEMLAREIKAGILLDGERLEPERQMAKRLGIAVGTLRKSLAVLESNGLLERIQGSGNYVRNAEVDKTIYGFFRLELTAGGGLPKATTLSVDKLKGSDDVNFSSGDEYYRIRRSRYLNDTAAALEEIWLDASLVEIPISQSELSDSLYQYYKEVLGFWIARVDDSVSVSVTPDWTPDEFSNGADATWGFVTRDSWDHLGRQVEYSKTWFDPLTTRYVARWK